VAVINPWGKTVKWRMVERKEVLTAGWHAALQFLILLKIRILW